MKLLFVILVLLLLTGCASTRVATSIGEDIGYSFRKAADKGEIAAKDSIKAWPYVSGLVRGALGEEFEYKVPMSAQNTMDTLDELSMKEVLTVEDSGTVIGSYLRLEYIAVVEGWNKYGISIWKAVKMYLGR